jgi:hypothetical protein
VVLAVAGVWGLWRLQMVEQNSLNRDHQRLVELCTAIPNVAAESEDALIDVVVQRDTAEHLSHAQIADVIRLGHALTARARALAVAGLSNCPKNK